MWSPVLYVLCAREDACTASSAERFFLASVRADWAFLDLALQGGKVALGVSESRGNVVLVDDEDVMLLVILVVC